jgi:outer membrane receptor protein involved in Fe transport
MPIGALVLLHALLLQAPAGSPAVRENVVVTAERAPEPRESVPAAVSVLTREEIEGLPAQDLGELIRYLPGFHVNFGTPFGGAPMVSARGFFGGGEAEYVQLLVDGVPVSDVESGLADWRRIRASDVERVEALRGPASALYGDTALGGLIQVFTRRAARGALGGTVSLSGGSFGSFGADASGSFPAGTATLGIAASASRTDGSRDHAASEEEGADLSLQLPAGGASWTLALSGSSRDRQEPGPRTAAELARDRFGSDPLFRFDRDETRRGRASLSFRGGGETAPLRGHLYGALRDTEATRTLLIAAGVGDRIFRSIESDAIGGSFEAEKSFARGTREARVVAGLDFARESLDSAYRSVDDGGERGSEVARVSGRRDRLGLFFSGAWEPAPRLRLTAGARWDSIADRFGSAGDVSRNAWSPRAGLTVRLGRLDVNPISVFVQASRAFQAPTVDQLFDPRPFPDFAGGTFEISNPRLRPQRAKTVEAGVSRRTGSSSLEVVVYRTEVDDEIDFDTATFRYANIGRTRHEGVEASARLFASGPVSPFVSWSWNRTEPLEGENRGRQLKNVPEHLVRPGITVALPGEMRLEAAGTILTGRHLDDAHQSPLDDAATVDVRLQKRFGRFSARADFLNVTNARWEEVGLALPDFEGELAPYYFPAAGFAARLGMEWRF